MIMEEKIFNNTAVNKTTNINAEVFEIAKKLASYIWISVFACSAAFVIYDSLVQSIYMVFF